MSTSERLDQEQWVAFIQCYPQMMKNHQKDFFWQNPEVS
jgi:hypothetical protein